MSSQLNVATSTASYTGPIFDADTHFWETDEAWTKYLPRDAAEKYGVSFHTGDDGDYAMYVGPAKWRSAPTTSSRTAACQRRASCMNGCAR